MGKPCHQMKRWAGEATVGVGESRFTGNRAPWGMEGAGKAERTSTALGCPSHAGPLRLDSPSLERETWDP